MFSPIDQCQKPLQSFWQLRGKKNQLITFWKKTKPCLYPKWFNNSFEFCNWKTLSGLNKYHIIVSSVVINGCTTFFKHGFHACCLRQTLSMSINYIYSNYTELQYSCLQLPTSFPALVSIFIHTFECPSLLNGPYLVCASVKSGCCYSCSCFRDEYSVAEWVAICLLSIIDLWLTRVQRSWWQASI